MKNDVHNNPSRAFTMAEVLIVVGIIGVVSTLTIPNLVKNYQDNQYKVAYKKAYSNLSQALLKANGDSKIIELSGLYGSQGAEANFISIKEYFIVSKECSTTELSKCWEMQGEKFRTEPANSLVQSFIDNAGVAWRLREPDSAGKYPTILVDTNGNKKPNQYGKDRFPLFFASSSKAIDLSQGSADSIGKPIKIIPHVDVTTISADNLSICPSVAKNNCYYTKWLAD